MRFHQGDLAGHLYPVGWLDNRCRYQPEELTAKVFMTNVQSLASVLRRQRIEVGSSNRHRVFSNSAAWLFSCLSSGVAVVWNGNAANKKIGIPVQ